MAEDKARSQGRFPDMPESSAITEEMRRAIGTLTLPEFPAEDVTIWAILRYAAATEDPNPLWWDDEYARSTRWGSLIAPPTFVEVYSPHNRTMREKGGELVQLCAPFEPPFERQLLGGEEFEFFGPIRPGDAISGRALLGDVYEKKSRSTSGMLVLMREDKEYHNQKGVLVARTNWTRIFVEVPPPAALVLPPPVPERAVRPATICPAQVYFDDVEVGTIIPSMEKHVTMTTIAKWAGATGDVGPPHLDHEYMKTVYGMPSVISHGALNGAYLAQLVTNWIGGWGVLKKHSTQYRGNTFPRDIITFQGKVVRKWVEQGENLLECETWAENQHGIIVTLGKSTVSLPARGSCPARRSILTIRFPNSCQGSFS
jgi:acyl dehydratase